jgi:hypothetical protein
VDGVLRGSTPVSTVAGNNRNLNIAFSWGGGTPTRFFRGSVDELAIYSRALNGAEIASIYNAGAAGKRTDGPYTA